ncbi:signal recognition particle 54 kDa protein 2 [Tanacetum coccineum]
MKEYMMKKIAKASSLQKNEVVKMFQEYKIFANIRNMIKGLQFNKKEGMRLLSQYMTALQENMVIPPQFLRVSDDQRQKLWVMLFAPWIFLNNLHTFYDKKRLRILPNKSNIAKIRKERREEWGQIKFRYEKETKVKRSGTYGERIEPRIEPSLKFKNNLGKNFIDFLPNPFENISSDGDGSEIHNDPNELNDNNASPNPFENPSPSLDISALSGKIITCSSDYNKNLWVYESKPSDNNLKIGTTVALSKGLSRKSMKFFPRLFLNFKDGSIPGSILSP